MATAPKQGTVVPNRVFVGGIPTSAMESELHNLFLKYGNVKAAKIILDRSGISKGYGFVTFECDDEAAKALKESEAQAPILRERKLNVARAVKKTLPSPIGSAVSSVQSPSRLFQSPYPLVLQQPLYVPQYYAQVPGGGYHQQHHFYNDSHVFQYGSVGHDYSEASEASPSEKYPKSSSCSSDYDSSGANTPTTKACHHPVSAYRFAANNIHSPTVHAQPYQLHQVMPKSGMAIMAYPSSFVVGTPTIVQVKEAGNNEHDNVMTEFSFLQSPVSPTPMTPPPTPWAPISCDFGSNVDSSCKN